MTSHKLSIASEFQRLRALVDEREFGKAYESIIRLSTNASLDALEKSELLLIQSKCLYFSGRYDEAFEVVGKALDLSKQSNRHALYAEQKFVLGRILNLRGQHEEAIEELTEAYAFFRRADDPTASLNPLMTIGLIHQTKGNLAQALSVFESISVKARELGDTIDLILSMFNSCRVAIVRGDLNAAAQALVVVSDFVELEVHKLRIQNLRGMVYVWRLEFAESHKLLSRAADSYLAKELSRDVAVCLEYLGLNEYFAGNYKKAREYYDQVLAMPEPTASAVAQTLRMLTDVEIAEGNWEAAKTTAAKAEVAITRISERIELGALWRAYGHIHTHDNDHAKAREYFEKSIDLLRQLGARYELALSHFDAGRSQAYSSDQQIEYLNQAKALFVEMEVPKRVAQVDAAIGKIAAVNVESNGNGKRKLTLKAKAAEVPVIIAASEAMKKIVALADRIKDNDMNILITGETGTGKDLLAEYIHKSSLRAGKPFVVVNCAAIPENLLELELFGAKKGTFTGSTSDKPGLIESASGGSFFLNEIGEAGIAIQTKLLQVIEEKAVRRLGDNASIKIDVRFIAATNQNLREQIAKGEFRNDLYYRLNVMPICLPPLRERAEDAVALLQLLFANHGIELNGDFGRVEKSLRNYSWPGNVRELIAIVNRVASNHEANGGNLFDLLNSEFDMDSPDSEERHHLLQVVAKHGGNKSRAAQELGIPVTTLRSRLNKFNL